MCATTIGKKHKQQQQQQQLGKSKVITRDRQKEMLWENAKKWDKMKTKINYKTECKYARVCVRVFLMFLLKSDEIVNRLRDEYD